MLDKLQEWLDTAKASIAEQEWFIEAKTKFDELDPQSRNNLKFAGFGLSILMIVFMIFSAIWSVHGLKAELIEKRSLLNTIQTANDEMRRLKDSYSAPGSLPGGGGAAPETGPWLPYFESIAAANGVDKTALIVSSEKSGNSGEQSKEILYELSLKHVNIKQVVRYAFSLENGQRPIKLRNLSIDTKGDSAGYLDANLAISAFTLVAPK